MLGKIFKNVLICFDELVRKLGLLGSKKKDCRERLEKVLLKVVFILRGFVKF